MSRHIPLSEDYLDRPEPCHFCGKVKDTIPICSECYINAIDEELVDAVRWYFETKEAQHHYMKILNGFVDVGWVVRNKNCGTYKNLSIMAGEAESRLRELVRRR